MGPAGGSRHGAPPARTHAAHSKVETFTTARLVCRFEQPPTYETDGEWNRARSAELVIETRPRALSVLVPPA